MLKKIAATAALLGLSACAGVQAPPAVYPDLKGEHPVSVLVAPPVNKTTQLEASDQVLAILPLALAERGYYVFPVNAVKTVLAEEGLSQADRVRQIPTPKLAGLFGADAVLYVTVQDWNARYALVATVTTVTMDYQLVSGKTGQTLWSTTKTVSLNSNAGQSGGDPLVMLISMAVNAAVARAVPEYLPAARYVNNMALYESGTGLLPGKYAPVAAAK